MNSRTSSIRERLRSVVAPTREWGRATACRVPGHTRPAAAGVAVAAMVLLATTRLVLNSPLSVPGPLGGTVDAIRSLAVVTSGVAAVAVGAATDDDLVRVGLVAAGVFGLLAAVSPAAALPAVGAVAVGGALAGTPALQTTDRRTLGRAAVVAVLVFGLGVSLAAAVDVHPSALRPAGSTLALAGAAATPLVVRPTRVGWAVGGVAGAVVLAAGNAAPFVSGAVLLVVGGVVGAPLGLVALATGGATAAAVGGLATGRTAPGLGAALLVAAGVPATLPRALPVALAIGLLAGGDHR